MEVGEGAFPSTTAASAPAHLSDFLHKKGDLVSDFKELTCKMYPVQGSAVGNDHHQNYPCYTAAESPKAVKEPGEYETVITLSPSLCFGA